MNAPPLLVSFNSLTKFLEAIPSSQREKYHQYIMTLHEKSLPVAMSEACLAVLFGYSIDFVYALSKKQHKFYRSFQIRQNKKVRTIHSPRVALKAVQKWIGTHLSQSLSFSPHVFGFVKGKSFADAAKLHEGAKWIFSVDIEDFFNSISRPQVALALTNIGYPAESSELMAKLCTLSNVLAQGSPASPVLSNLVLQDIDKNLQELAERFSVRVSRYADDIVFSGIEKFDPNLQKQLESIFDGTSFSLNKDKTYFSDATKGQRLKVHGLLVKEDKIRLTKGYRNKIRAYRHMLEQEKVCSKDIYRLEGHIKFSDFIEKKNKQN